MDQNQNASPSTPAGVTPIAGYQPNYMMARPLTQPFMHGTPVPVPMDSNPQPLPMGMMHPGLLPTSAWLNPASQGFSYPQGHFQPPLMMQHDGTTGYPPFHPMMAAPSISPRAPLMKNDRDGGSQWLPSMLTNAICPPDIKNPHPLKRTWASWLQLSESTMSGNEMAGSSYAANMILPTEESLKTVEDTMTFLYRIQLPSQWIDSDPIGHNQKGSVPVDGICLFIEGITPQWEDEQNRSGGHLELKFQQRPNNIEYFKFVVDHIWLATVLAVTTATGTVDPDHLTTGIRLIKKSNKKKDMNSHPFLRLEVWLTNCSLDQKNDFTNRLNDYIQRSFLNGKPLCMRDLPLFDENEWRYHGDATKGGISKRGFARADSRTLTGRNKAISAATPKPSNR